MCCAFVFVFQQILRKFSGAARELEDYKKTKEELEVITFHFDLVVLTPFFIL